MWRMPPRLSLKRKTSLLDSSKVQKMMLPCSIFDKFFLNDPWSFSFILFYFFNWSQWRWLQVFTPSIKLLKSVITPFEFQQKKCTWEGNSSKSSRQVNNIIFFVSHFVPLPSQSPINLKLSGYFSSYNSRCTFFFKGGKVAVMIIPYFYTTVIANLCPNLFCHFKSDTETIYYFGLAIYK